MAEWQTVDSAPYMEEILVWMPDLGLQRVICRMHVEPQVSLDQQHPWCDRHTHAVYHVDSVTHWKPLDPPPE